jgi:plasmid stabilization system protein ParE
MHRIVVDDVRRKILKNFPYGLYYQVEENRVVVIGVFHTSRDAKHGRDRIEEESQEGAE